MDNLKIDGTDHSPEVDLDFANGNLSLSGMSYLEDVNGFYAPILEKIELYLSATNDIDIAFTFQMIYFNSSSARVVLRLFEALDAAAERGNRVNVNWRYAADDDSMEEQGEEYGEDLVHAKFQLIPFDD